MENESLQLDLLCTTHVLSFGTKLSKNKTRERGVVIISLNITVDRLSSGMEEEQNISPPLA
jgi:hypothetical protein